MKFLIEQLKTRLAYQGSLPLPSLGMSGDELPMNHADDSFRHVPRWRHPGGQVCFDDHFKDDLEWAISQPQARHQTRRNHEDDDVCRLVKVSPPYFDGNLDPKAFLDWAISVDQYFDWSNMSETLHAYTS